MPMTAKTWMTQACAAIWKRMAIGVRALFIHALVLTIALPPTWIITAVVHTSAAEASSYGVGYSKYQKGDFKGAELALRQALTKKMPRASMAKTYKLLGICQYMLGNKNAASDSFQRALRVVPTTAVSPSEVLDDTVVPFFNRIKAQVRKSAPAKPIAKPATKVAPVAKTPPPPTPKTIAGGNRPLKKTFLKVLSNAPNASISLDGILAGQANSLINTDPGKVMIDVSAPGYRSRTVTVNVTANQENTVTVNLVKPQPKPKPKPKPKPVAKPKSKPAPSVAQKQRPQKKRPNKYTPDPGVDMFEESGTGAEGGGGVDLAAQFDAEAAGYAAPQAQQPGYGPQPGYGAQPGYAAPPPQYYAPPPQYYAPPPQYYAPPPQYYAPPPAPPPPADPYASGGGYAEAAPPVETIQDPAANASSSGSGGGSGNNLFITLLPFGAGQFQNGSMIFGFGFLAAEAGAVYYYYSKSQESNAFAEKANKYIIENCQEPDSDEETCLKYRQDSDAYVQDLRSKSKIGLIAFAGLWAVGVAEAIINEPKPQPKKRKKQRRYGGFAYTPTVDGHHFSILGKENERKLFAYEVGLNVAPAGTVNWPVRSDNSLETNLERELPEKNQLSLSLTLEF